MVNSIGQLEGLKRLLMEANKKIVVELAMRYGNPSIDSAILKNDGSRRSKAVHFTSLSTVLR